MSHSCMVKGCGRKLSTRHLCCLEHWSLVPVPLQVALVEALATWKAARRPPFPGPGRDAWRAAGRAYTDAARAVLAAIADAESDEREGLDENDPRAMGWVDGRGRP